MLYFAYGSNMDPRQMAERCPDSELVGIGILPDYELCFPRGSARRNCGVSSVRQQAGSHVWGVIYRLNAEDMTTLDEHEGFRTDRPASENRYNRIEVAVLCNGELTPVSTYVAMPEDQPPLPNAAYLKHLRYGARHHRLPAEYLAFLDSLACA